jgi:hypothetical protein
MGHQAISVSDDYFRKIDLKPREETIIKEIQDQFPFTPEKIVWESKYYNTGIGAFHVSGMWEGNKPAILKVQGAKTEISEAEMIHAFEKQNKSTLVRPPQIYTYLPWDDKKQYEALVMEHVQGEFIVEHSQPANREQIQEFFRVIDEYRRNCVNEPWLDKPEKTSYKEAFMNKKRKIRLDHPEKDIVTKEDDELVLKMIDFLDTEIGKEELFFTQGHVSVYDLIKYKNQVVMFSNLFWTYRWPLYDFVFGYMWLMMEIAHLSEQEIKAQMQLWQEEMKQTETVKKYPEKVLNIALLERAVGAFNLDFLLIPEKRDKFKMQSILGEEINRLYTALK